MTTQDAGRDESLAALEPATVEITLGGRTFVVRELTARELIPVHDDLVRMVRAMSRLLPIEDEIDAAAKVAQAVTGIDAERWRNAGTGKLYAVIRAAVAVNMDFFARRVETLALIDAGDPTAGDGPTLSTTSAHAATPTP